MKLENLQKKNPKDLEKDKKKYYKIFFYIFSTVEKC